MLNKVTLIGRLGNDPEVRYMPNGKPVANISIATSRRWKDKQTGERKEETEWHRLIFFNRLAEIAGEYLMKGSLIYIEGRIRTNKWQDQSGQDKYTTEIVAEQMTMLDSKGGDTGNSNDSQSTSYTSAQQQQSTSSQKSQNSPPPASYEDFNDSIPF